MLLHDCDFGEIALQRAPVIIRRQLSFNLTRTTSGAQWCQYECPSRNASPLPTFRHAGPELPAASDPSGWLRASMYFGSIMINIF